MPGVFYGDQKVKIFFGDIKIRKAYLGDKLVYTCENPVTYIENGRQHMEYVEEGMTVLSPESFAPSKPGWTFRGWSISANSINIQTNLVMGEMPITLYAVWSMGSYIPDQPLPFTYSGPADGLYYSPGGSWTATASIDDVYDIGNNTTGEVAIIVSVAGTNGRGWVNRPGAGTEEYTGYPGYGGAVFHIGGIGAITAKIENTGAWKYSGGDVNIRNVVLKGSSNVEWSVG